MVDVDPRAQVSSKTLAAIIGVTERRVQQLEAESVLVNVGEGRSKRFDLSAAVQAWADYKTKSEIDRLGGLETPERADYDFERARKLKLENDASEQLLIETPAAIAAIDHILGEVRTGLSGVGPQVTDDVEMRRRIDDATDHVLTSLVARFEQAVTALREGRDPLAADATDNA